MAPAASKPPPPNAKAQRTRTVKQALIAREAPRRCGVRCSARLGATLADIGPGPAVLDMVAGIGGIDTLDEPLAVRPRLPAGSVEDCLAEVVHRLEGWKPSGRQGQNRV